MTRRTLAALAGLLLLQAAWVLTVPPFRGLDEHDHAYRAASVARGEWSPRHEPSPDGWGELVTVPSDLVEAANPVCEALPYTTADNCTGAGGGGPTTTVASSATRYHPAFYAYIGAAALPFEGAAALYAMRVAGALACAGLLVLAATATRGWARSSWPSVALLLVLTPTLLYSTAVAAPNGVEVASAVLLWCTLLGLVRGARDGGGPRTRWVTAAAVAAVPLVTVRGLGPLWVLLTALTVALLVPRGGLVPLLRARSVQVAAGVTGLATLGAAAWVGLAGPPDTASGGMQFPGDPWRTVPGQWVLWFFQSLAAFPARDELAPWGLYAVGLLAWWVFVAVAWRWATGRERWALVTVAAMATLVPVAITVTTYATLGNAWQGRYGYPYAMGALLIAGFALDRAARGRWRHVPLAVVATGALALGLTLVSQVAALLDLAEHSPLAGTDAWWQPAVWVVVLLDVVGYTLLTAALLPDRGTTATVRLGSLPR